VLKIVTFLWRRNKTGYMLPAVCDYTAAHVNTLQSMLSRHLHTPHELICITDMPDGVKCRTIPLWDDLAALGGCYRRLKMFSPEMKELIGDRFAWIDLDCVITGDVTPIFTKTQPMIINRYGPGDFSKQTYNGSLVIMDAGVRCDVWDDFDPVLSPLKMKQETEKKHLIGSDQAWISYKVHNACAVGREDGIYGARQVEHVLPSNCRIVFFSGLRDPSTAGYKWIPEHYR
jgi:hypothetical protein